MFHSWPKDGDKVCATCGVNGESQTYDCVNRKLTNEELVKIKDRTLDYVNGKWKTYVDVGTFPGSGEK